MPAVGACGLVYVRSYGSSQGKQKRLGIGSTYYVKGYWWLAGHAGAIILFVSELASSPGLAGWKRGFWYGGVSIGTVAGCEVLKGH